ncbi:MarR family winged helix-turn-helix transcriptional regulator [Nocardia sp. CS682]|uniref:MarR family winged helix-turn-helix transcriptional regulator n=1 Tax=Nocardia sp. CS682 TaxID=1047172 RepID=UPI0010755F22|nr:MarR family transcriptional regulator [Nocardia sp. CS682]QBS45118.1 MarR family transcriptional regulator [Nocardia sp. CS682]
MPRSSPPVAPTALDVMATLAEFCRVYQQDFLAAAQGLDLTYSQAKLLFLLAEPRAMRDLAEALSCDASNITLLIDRLEQRGLVERHIDQADRRVKKVVATAEGTAIAQQVRERMHGVRAALETLTPARRRNLQGILEQLHAHMTSSPD